MIRIITLLIALSVGGFASAQKLKFKEKRSVKRITKHITYLASDKLEGRGTGAPGEVLSAEYIAKYFKKCGLKPHGDNGTYIQEFNITTLRLAGSKTALLWNGQPRALFAEFFPISYSANNGTAKGELVEVGYGIVADKLGRNDYKGKNVKGNIVAINLGSPDGIHPHSKFVAWHGIQIRVDLAIKQGASAVMFYRSDAKVAEPDGELSLVMRPSSIPVVFINAVLDKFEVAGQVDLTIDVITDVEYGHNVVGFKDNGAKTTVVIGAHHDHLGRGEISGSLSTESNAIHNGADDNASGTSALFEIARVLDRKKSWNSENNYLFIAFSGEEMGLLGSKYYVNYPSIDLATINYMFNMDMVGRLDSTLVINGVGTSSAFNRALESFPKSAERIAKIKTTPGGMGASDHTSFYLKGIPVLHFFTGQHKEYHKPEDDIELLNLEGELFVIQGMLYMIKELNEQGKLDYQKTKSESGKRRGKFAVTLGVMPDYVFDGEGMRIDGVKDGKPGSNAGLLAGDVVIAMGGKSIKNMMDYMNLLGTLKKGQLVDLTVMRDGALKQLKVQF
jgi:aminopeptidase YwaD